MTQCTAISMCQYMAVAGAGAGVKIMVKLEPEPKINNLSSETLIFGFKCYTVLGCFSF